MTACPVCEAEVATVLTDPDVKRFVPHGECSGGYARVDEAGTTLESRYTEPRDECRHPERWHSPDWDSPEDEVSDLVAALVAALRPDVVVETGTALGLTAARIGEVLAQAGVGTLYTIEIDAGRAADARLLLENLPVKVEEGDSMDWTPPEGIGFAWFDSLLPLRAPEFRRFYPLFAPGAIVGFHDTGSHYERHGLWAAIEQLEADQMLLPIRLRTPRGLVLGEVV